LADEGVSLIGLLYIITTVAEHLHLLSLLEKHLNTLPKQDKAEISKKRLEKHLKIKISFELSNFLYKKNRQAYTMKLKLHMWV